MPTIIGLTGVAKAGKDTFFKGLQLAYPELKFTRFSVGDIIRKDLCSFISKKIGIDIWKATPAQKELVRPLLAWYGDIQRKTTSGSYFIEQLREQILHPIHKNSICVITDVRFKEFEYDEPDFIREYNGKLIHLTRKLPDGTISQPANHLESTNNPILQNIADVQLVWDTIITDKQDVNSIEFNLEISKVIKTMEPQLQMLFQTYRN